MRKEILTERVWVSERTLRKLNILKARLCLKSLNEVVLWLMEKDGE